MTVTCETSLSMDALALLTCYFSKGPKQSLVIGGDGALSVLSDRANDAMNELVAGGYVVAEKFNSFGRMKYVGTEKSVGFRLSNSDMEKYGRWSVTRLVGEHQPKETGNE